MCGRFTLHSRLNLLLQQFALEAGPELAPRYNVSPTQSVPIVRVQSETGKRELVPLRWGLVPSWAKDLKIGNRMINARSETVASKPSFRAAFKRRRCLVPADGYYEWKTTESGKQPYLIHRDDGALLAMAGLWESWHTDQPDGVETFTIITTTASSTTADIHDRMPALLEPDDYDLWLDPAFENGDHLQSLLRPDESGSLIAEPVSRYVNSPQHDDPECIRPVDLSE